ncbi:MAG: gliding motility-associated C-terminal domain-containing protein [Crocinitomicaceae bacterium]|nr:gliding motility-associated C-terminal domain-containing protein [Crocinitomicaceae bacterium]
MNCKKLILAISLMLASVSLAQPPLDWASYATVGGGYEDYVEDVFVDAAGNTYACGNFRGSLTFGSDNLFASSAGQAFVVKYDPNGNPLWAIQSNGNAQAFAKSIFVDAAGAVYVTGYHSHSILSFAGLSLPSSSNEGFYILKVTSSGLPIHLVGPTAGSTGKSQSWAIVGEGDAVYIAGSHKAGLTLTGGPTLPATAGQSDVFFAKVDSNLASFTWAFSHGGPSNDFSRGITIDGNILYATGVYGPATCTFNAGTDYVLPDYGDLSSWVTRINPLTGDISWATSAGSANGPCRSNDISAVAGEIYITGGCSDEMVFAEDPSFTGPFTYNDTLFSNGEIDAFVARYDASGNAQSQWSDGGIATDEAFGVAVDLTCSEIQICGSFQDSVNFGGTTPLMANDKDIFVAAYDNVGVLSWASRQICDDDAIANAISTSGGISSVGGEIYGDGFFKTDPMTLTDWNGYSDHFVFSFDCTTPVPCGPEIDACQQNDTVIADPSCAYVLADYTGISVIDGCMSGGISVNQNPPPLSILGAGVHEINLTAVDLIGTKDVCFFNVVVKATNKARIAQCGDKFINETTSGDGNDYNSFSCSSTSTNGEDALYQVTVDAGNQILQIKMDNVVDANDQFVYVYWLQNNCPTSGNCVEIDSFEVSSAQFSNNSQYLTFPAAGPGTYYLVIDSKTDFIQQYDIEFMCSSAGISLDTTASCSAIDTDNDGIIPYLNGSSADLTVQPCETVTICHDLFIANENGWEWMDSVSMSLGDCYQNITNMTPTSPPNDNGFYDSFGEWVASYDSGSNSILWEFTHSSSNPWGDGNTGEYNCQAYSFCFDAEISSTCNNNSNLTIGIAVGDDAGKGSGAPSNVFDIGNSNDFNLQDDDPYFSYSSNVFCDGDPSVSPDSITTPGGTFTASPGIVFTDGSPSPTGEIDLTASSIGGPYTITYTVGLCPFSQSFILEVYAQENPSFSYSQAAYCQGDPDPTPLISGTPGGTFTAPVEIVFISNLTGEIDLDASTAGGPYWIKYTTPGPFCVNADSVQVTINPEDDPTFNYASTIHCAADANVLPVFIATPGGNFSENTGNIVLNATTGEVDIASSQAGNYFISYTSPGICPNIDSVQFSILPEDDPSFNYSDTAYCQHESNPVANITGTGGGTFTAPGDITFISAATGEIDLMNSTVGGPYWVTYTSPGPTCINKDSTQITIHAEDDSSFTYASAILCTGDPDPIPTITGTPGGTFTASAGIIFTDGSPSPTGEIDVSASTIGGAYTVTYTTPGPQCPNDHDFILSIFDEDDPTIAYSSNTYCQNQSDPVPAVITPGGTFSGPVVFIDTITGEIDLSASPSGGPHEIVYTSPGPECPNTDTAFITINALDDPSFTYGATEFCINDGLITANVTGLSGGVFSTSDSLNLVLDTTSGAIDLAISSAGGPYSVQYLTNGACPDSSQVSITIYGQPVAEAGPDQEIYFTYNTNLEAVPPTSGTGVWTILTGTGTIVDDSLATSEITDLENGTTTLLWTVDNGVCPSSSDQVTITVSGLFIPEVVTPNGDGKNDVFEISGIELLPNTVQIFNRWGQKVYESTDYQNDWNGTNANGKELVDDTYFYVVTAKETKFTGFVVLKR